jgi:hypothetical protein
MDHEQQASMARETMRILNDWAVPPEAQLALLGFPKGSKPRSLNRYRSGGETFPEAPERLQRIGCILSISKALQTMFPHSGSMADLWVTTANTYFNDRSPLEIMIEHGLSGMQNVSHHLNNNDGW